MGQLLRRLLLAAVLTTVAVRASAQVNLVSNGSFEASSTPAGWGWTYNEGMAIGYPSAADGRNWVEVFGTLYQTINTTPGATYDLRFAFSGNFNSPSSSVLDVQWGNIDLGTVSWNPSGHNINNLGWIWKDFQVTATDYSTLLDFVNPNVGTARIPNLDAVSVVQVAPAPEPSIACLFCVGFFGTYGWRKFRRNSA